MAPQFTALRNFPGLQLVRPPPDVDDERPEYHGASPPQLPTTHNFPAGGGGGSSSSATATAATGVRQMQAAVRRRLENGHAHTHTHPFCLRGGPPC